MAARRPWTEQELLTALYLYCRLPFGRLHHRNPEIIYFARLMDRTPGALAMKLVNLAHIDPQLDRKGLSSVSAGDRTAWQRMEADWGRFVRESEAEVQRLLGQEGEGTGAEERERLTSEGEGLADTPQPAEMEYDADFWKRAPDPAERERLTRVRIHQPFFRQAVLSAHDRRCCISGLSLESLLEAGHIVPWSADKDNRLNPRNGLALSVLHHKAFDDGLLTIDEDLRVCVSRKVRPAAKDYFYASALQNYHGQKIREPQKFLPDQAFLAYHRENIFEKRGE